MLFQNFNIVHYTELTPHVKFFYNHRMMNKKMHQKTGDSVILKIRRERLRQGLSQYRVAKDTGMSKSSLLYIENLTQRPTLDTVILLATYLKMDLRDLFSF